MFISTDKDTKGKYFDRQKVYEYLLDENPDPKRALQVPELLCMLDYMIAFRLHSCDTERTGGTLSKILTKHRQNMKDDLLIALVFLRENLPAVVDVDFDRIVEKWHEHLAKLNRRNDAGQSVTSTYEQGSSTFRRLISVEREKGVRPLLNKIQKF